MTRVEPARPGRSDDRPLVARTVELHGPDAPADLSELLEHLGPGGFAWLDGARGLVTRGVAARVRASAAAALLDTIEGAPSDGPRGPIAVGALPFAHAARDGELVIPALVVGRDADGRCWSTSVSAAGDASGGAPARLRRAPRGAARVSVTSGVDQARWTDMVGAALDEIDAGRLAKVVLARELVVESDAAFDVPSILRYLRRHQPGCFVFAAGGFVGATPELLVRVAGEQVESRPMAGTVPRGGTAADDEHATASLLASSKLGHEHRLVVDAVVEALARHCDEVRAGPTEPARLATVTHLATAITARRPAPCGPGALELALALHPTPAVGGTPRDGALALIERIEPSGRGLYAGPVGWTNAAGDGEWAVGLRSATIEPGAGATGGRARLLAGAGIVAGSDPAAEWAETQAKLEPMLQALIRL